MFYTMPSRFGSNLNANQAQMDANQAGADAREAKTETELLRHDIDRLLMITEALWTFLKQAHGYSDEQLANAVKEIDLRDGRLDGRAQPPAPSPCPHCGKINSARRSRWLCLQIEQLPPPAPFLAGNKSCLCRWLS
jgi:hypothetical protein